MRSRSNYWVVNGPNACVGNGSLIPVQEREMYSHVWHTYDASDYLGSDYFVRAINKMQREQVKSMCMFDL